MKAIQIKYLPATDTLSGRLKAWTEAGQLVEPIDSSLDAMVQARVLAEKYIRKHGWNEGWNTIGVTGFGCLPNGDYVATLGE